MKKFQCIHKSSGCSRSSSRGTANADFSPAPGTHYEVVNFDAASSLTVTSPVDGVFSASGDDAFITTEGGKIVSFNNIDQ